MRLGVQTRPGQKFISRALLHLCPLANSAMMSKLTTHCQWEDETVRERTGHPPSYAEAKKMKSLTLHTDGCPKGLFFFFFFSTCSSLNNKDKPTLPAVNIKT